jgi:hypothetical protein
MRPAAEVARLAHASLHDEPPALAQDRVVTAPNDSTSLGEQPNEANRLRDARAARDGQGLVDASSDAAARQRRSDAGIVARPSHRLRVTVSAPPFSTRVVDSESTEDAGSDVEEWRKLLFSPLNVELVNAEAPVLLEVAEAARMLGLSVSRVRALVELNRLPIAATTARGVRLFHLGAVEALRLERAAVKRTRKRKGR